MAFFGLTALGPQDSFAAAMKSARTLEFFSDADVGKAFDAAGGPGTDVGKALTKMYRGPPPEKELAAVEEEVAASGAALTRAALVEAVSTIRKRLFEAQQAGLHYVGPGSEFSSTSEYHTAMLKHQRMKEGPRDKYAIPLTASQEYGWAGAVGKAPTFPKTSCEETVYQAELIKSGVYY